MVLTCWLSGWSGSPPPWTATWTPRPGAARRSRRCAGSTGAGKTFLTRYLAERALRRGFAAAEVQISETETPLHKLETVYQRVGEALRTASFPPSALRPVLDSWLFTLETDATAADPELAGRGRDAADEAVGTLLEGRHRAEQAFAEARDCVIVATSTLELGVDVGDLDRVIQVNDPPRVAAFLQRAGRTGRRPGSRRNCLFLALNTGSLLRAAGLLHLWGQGYVEPVVAPPEPRHIVAQQLLALCLQEHRIGSRLWVEHLANATLAARMADLDSAAQILTEPARFTVVDDLSR